MYNKLTHRSVMIVILLAVLLTGIGLKVEAQTKKNLIEVYKQLDKKDFEIQSTQKPEDEIKKMLEQIYCGPQLEKAKKYFSDLKAKGLCLKLDSAKYDSIKVLKHDARSAVLLVESKYSGDYMTVGQKGETMRELGVNMLYQIEMAKDDNRWKIKDLVVLKD